MYWLNVFFPILSGVVDICFYYSAVNNAGDPSTLWIIAFAVFVDIVGILQLLSGVILTKAVFSIRRFLIDNDHSDMINLKQMLIHSGAFLLYIVAEIAYYGTWTMRVNRNSTLLFYAQLGTTAYITFNFASQVLLIIIFWDLGDKEKLLFEDEEVELDPFAMMLAEFDEEQDLQARIWNRFQKEDGTGLRASTLRVTRASEALVRDTLKDFSASIRLSNTRSSQVAVDRGGDDINETLRESLAMRGSEVMRGS